MIVLDTAPWIWWVADPLRLSARARRAVRKEEEAGGLVVSAVSVWEVAWKHRLGKLEFDRDIRSWVALARAYRGVRIAPLEPDDALESAFLPEPFHRDPADRFVVALAKRLGCPLLTSDRRILDYEHVETIW